MELQNEKAQDLSAYPGSRYGWLILAASFYITTLTYGIQYSFGVFLIPLSDDLGWTRAMVSWVPALFMASICIFGFIAGLLSDRFGPRLMPLTGGFFIGLGLVLTSYITQPWQLYFYYSLMAGFGTGFAGPPIFATVVRWFPLRRGLALGIVATGIGVGTIVMAPLASWLISEYGWQASFRIIGFAAWTIPLASLFIKNKPELPLPSGVTATVTRGLTLSQALRTGKLWQIMTIFVLAYSGLLMVMYHVVPYAEDTGFDKIRAAGVLSIIAAVALGGRLVGGIAADRMGSRRVLLLAFTLQAIAMFWLSRDTSVFVFYAFAVLWGLGYGAWAPLLPAVTAEYFGLRHLGSILGFVSASFGLGGIIGPVVAGAAYNEVSSYAMAFLIGGLLLATAAAMVVFLKQPSETPIP